MCSLPPAEHPGSMDEAGFLHMWLCGGVRVYLEGPSFCVPVCPTAMCMFLCIVCVAIGCHCLQL